jgi:hypothetical protein
MAITKEDIQKAKQALTDGDQEELRAFANKLKSIIRAFS